uniref:Uncharacterized protein n=1 Tax=Cafeteria roenbergensis TaxID=33653 RepID=A0A7S0KAL2_CAFRO|mmetsp:Transcript_9894/g.38512  ORF Transcript_9894/g.38512 Transcript_9894/m.38512 type:complete len:409 (+) Transcript_9894:426-1652(+)
MRCSMVGLGNRSQLNDSMAAAAAAASTEAMADQIAKFATTAGETMSGTGWASLATLVLGLSKLAPEGKLNTKIHAIITDGENVICLKPRHPRAVVWTTDYKPRVAGYPSIEPIGIMDGLNFFVMGRDTNKPREQSRFITLAGGTVEKVVGKPHDLKLAGSAAGDPVWDQLKRELREELGPAANDLLSKSDVCTDWVAFNSSGTDAWKLDTCITAVLRVGEPLGPDFDSQKKLKEHHRKREKFRTALLEGTLPAEKALELCATFGPRDEISDIYFLPLHDMAHVWYSASTEAAGGLRCKYSDERDRILGLVARLLAKRAKDDSMSADKREAASAVLRHLVERMKDTSKRLRSVVGSVQKTSGKGWSQLPLQQAKTRLNKLRLALKSAREASAMAIAAQVDVSGGVVKDA